MLNRKLFTNILYWIAMVGLFFWFAYSKGWILTNFTSINPQQAITLMENDNNITVLDVRTIAEYKEGHLPTAKLLPLQNLTQNLSMLKKDKNKKVLVYCRTGSRSVAASRILVKHGFTPVNVRGGVIELTKAGVTLVK